MPPLIFSNPVATQVFAAAALLWFLPEAIGNAVQRAKVTRRTATVADKGSIAVVIALQDIGLILNFALAIVWPGAAITWQPALVFAAGIALMVLGVGLRWYAIWVLGRYFTRDVAVSADQPVVQRGPYRLIRHPAYSGTLLSTIGIGLAVTNWASLVAVVVFTLAGHLYRVHVEEAALARTLGQPYVDYMRRTKRFIPFVF